MFQKIKKIPGNVQEDSRECSKRFQGKLKKIPMNLIKKPGNAIKDLGGFSRGFRGVFEKIPGNNFNFKLIKATFYLKVNPNKQ